MRTTKPIWVLVIGIAVLTGCRQNVSITGQVILEGTPPPERQIIFDSASAALQVTNVVTTRHYVTSKNGGLANVLVEVKNITNTSQSTEPRTQPIPLTIHRAVYEPYVVAVQTNQPVYLRNLDPIGHTAHVSPPRGGKNRSKSIALMGGGPAVPAPKEPLWDRALRLIGLGKPPPKPAGVTELRFPLSDKFIQLKCDVHPWEYGYIAVLDHPYFAMTDKDGKFTLPPLPPGTYSLEARHLKAGMNSQRIVITSGRDSTFTIKFTPPQRQQ